MSDTLANSYNFCHDVTRKARSSFPLAFLLLPSDLRPAMGAIYAFNRVTDDLVDREARPEQLHAGLALWREMLERQFFSALDGTTSTETTKPPIDGEDSEAARILSTGQRLLPALVDTARRFEIPPESFRAVVEGVEMDLQGASFDTFEQLEAYCERVASAVGRMCIAVWGFQDETALEPARYCGIALQLTNILRDLVEDYQDGRVYLPREDFDKAGYDPARLGQREGGPEFLELMRGQIDRAESYYDRAKPLIALLDRRGRPVCKMVIDVYHRLLQKIARHPEAVLEGRVRIGQFTKTTIFLMRLVESFFCRS